MLQYYYKIVGLLVIVLVVTAPSYSQANDSVLAGGTQARNIFSIGVGLQHGFIFAHSRAVQNTKGANPTGIEIALGWQRNDTETWNLCNCFPKKRFVTYVL